MKPAIFLDRDGVLNVDYGYVNKIKDFEWIKDAREAIGYINSKNYYIFVVTNQSGIAREFYTEKDVVILHDYMVDELKEYGAQINEFFYSPYHPEVYNKKYNHLAHLRKPKTGMLDQAAEKWDIDKNNSFMVGDKDKDVECAKNFGIKGYLFKGGSLLDFIREII